MAAVRELRIYRIESGRLDDFLAAWTAGVAPLRRAAGFDVQGWIAPDDDTFVWLLAYDGPGTFEEADEAYYASPGRRAMDPNPSQWIVGEQTLRVTPYEVDGP
jgi:hypothetical protein